jgi:hypothetical protein
VSATPTQVVSLRVQGDLTTLTINSVGKAPAETVARQLLLEPSVLPKTLKVKGVSRVRHRLGHGLLVFRGRLDRPAEDRYLQHRRLPVHLDSLDRILEVGIEERLSCRVAIDQDRIITESPGQDVTDGAEDSKRVLSEQEGSPVRIGQ